MIGEWIRFGVTALCVVGGLFALFTALLGLFRFDYALNRLHAAAIADTLALGLVLLGVGATFLASRLLSGTVLKGVPSSFTLELPPYRRPQIGKVIVRSIFDRMPHFRLHRRRLSRVPDNDPDSALSRGSTVSSSPAPLWLPFGRYRQPGAPDS